MPNIKLLFTCPHDGKNDGTTTNPPIIKRDPNNFPSNNICPSDDGQGLEIRNDLLTEKLTEEIVRNIQSLSGKDPYTVYAEFKRELIDYNRKEECAFVQNVQSSVKAQEEYNKYHDEISQKIEEMLPDDDKGLAFLFDIHGTGEEKSPTTDPERNFIEVLIGTDQARSRQALTERDPNYFWSHKNGLIPLLATKRIRAFPENEIQEWEKHSLDGGHTIKTYGGTDRTKRGLVAIQIEVIHCIRNNRYCREKFAADMAECILKFVSPFL
jgi:hypothetical protein